jgi:hypothetical protein
MLPARPPEQSLRQWLRMALARTDDYGIALLLILATIIVLAAAWGPMAELISVALTGGTLLFIMHTSDVRGPAFRLAAFFVGLAVLGAATELAFDTDAYALTASLFGLVLAVVAPLVIVRRMAMSPTITFRLVLGALAIYLLIGLAYSYLFPVIARFSGQPFFVETTTPGSAIYLYFSYTTLATIGFGDFTAATNLGRMITVSEGLVGQLYLVSVVALLVGNIGRAMRQVAPATPNLDDPVSDRPVTRPER